MRSIKIVLLACMMVAGSCNGNNADAPIPPGKYAAQIRELEAADPAAHVSAAIAAGDLRFIGVMGVSLVVPGVSDMKVLSNPDRVPVIPNTTDAMENREHEHLQDVACHYALTYNQILLKRMQDDESLPEASTRLSASTRIQ